MTNHGGAGNPRFRGPGSLWKSSWKRKKLPRDRYDMPFFTPFFNQGEGDPKQWYEGQFSGFPLSMPFQGGPGTWLGCAIQVPALTPAANRSLMGYFSGGVNPGGWRLDHLITGEVQFSVGLGQNGGVLSVLGPATSPDVTYVFVCEFAQPAFLQNELRFYVPGPTGAAQLFATSGQFGFYNFPSFITPFRFGVVNPLADRGASSLHLAGLTMGSLKDVVSPVTTYTDFFKAVRDTLSIPAIALNDRIAAGAVFPNVPDPYTTDFGGTLVIAGGPQPIFNQKYPPNFPY